MAATLYTPQLLALATSLAAFPLSDRMPLQATARSKSCGSVVTLGLILGADGRIAQTGIKAQACAIGQASAAIFANAAPGYDLVGIVAAEQALANWLSGLGPMPDWPGLDPINPARAYPARHAAIMLAWHAAREALSSGEKPR